jgi:hypothetical protein
MAFFVAGWAWAWWLLLVVRAESSPMTRVAAVIASISSVSNGGRVSPRSWRRGGFDLIDLPWGSREIDPLPQALSAVIEIYKVSLQLIKTFN